MKQINLQDNLRKKFLKKGVKMMAPETVYFSKDTKIGKNVIIDPYVCLLYTSPSPRDGLLSRMPSSA